jgi:hypothetical protein
LKHEVFAMPKTPGNHAVNPMALSIDEVSRLLSAAGSRRITPEQIQADIDRGMPIGADGKINLIHYAAWLAREVQAR